MCVGYECGPYGRDSHTDRTHKHYTHSNLHINNTEYLRVCVYCELNVTK